MQNPRQPPGRRRAASVDHLRGTSAGMGALAPLVRHIVRAIDVAAPAPEPTFAPAPPPRARPVPAPKRTPQQEAGLKWAAGLQGEYFAAEDEMGRLRGAGARLRTARAQKEKSGLAVAGARRKLGEAQDALARAAGMRGEQRGFTKRLRKGKYEEEMAEAARLEVEGTEGTERHSRELAIFRKVEGEDGQRVAGCEVDVRRLKALDGRRKKILQELFTGFMAGDAAENAAEDRRDKTRFDRDQRKEALVVSMKALAVISGAVGDLESVVRLLQTSAQSNQADMMMDGTQGFGGMAGRQTYYNMERAAGLAKRANAALVEAKRLNPQLPVSRSADVKQSAMAFTSLFRDSTFSDMRQGYKIRKQLTSASAAYREAAAAGVWQERETNGFRIGLQRAEAEFMAAEDALEVERVRLIRVPIVV